MKLALRHSRCIPKKATENGDENISDRNKWLHVITLTNISNAAEVTKI